MRDHQSYLERGYTDGPICACCASGTDNLDDAGLCVECAATEAHVQSALDLDADPQGFEPADEALFVYTPSLAELDAWGRQQLDELCSVVDFYPAAVGS
ncbi:MAG: hypothetical protein EKK55_20135 [Rhodocyclaceae bacterium]|nr:MAG: hypothetical protein EKK55_20135 [Rhodocyclaceae bacterium]